MINSVNLVGRLTKDPELKYTPSGVPVATFTLAVNRSFTNGQGEREADFIQCLVWRKPAENLVNYQKKGNQIGVTGRIQTRYYEGQDGKRVYVTEVVAENIAYLDSARNNDNQQSNNSGNTSYNNNNSNSDSNRRLTRVDEDPFANHGAPIDISDDDLPF